MCFYCSSGGTSVISMLSAAQDCATWTAASPQLHAFSHLLLGCPAALRHGKAAVFGILTRCVADAADVELRVAALQLATGLLSAPELAAELGPNNVGRHAFCCSESLLDVPKL